MRTDGTGREKSKTLQKVLADLKKGNQRSLIPALEGNVNTPKLLSQRRRSKKSFATKSGVGIVKLIDKRSALDVSSVDTILPLLMVSPNSTHRKKSALSTLMPNNFYCMIIHPRNTTYKLNSPFLQPGAHMPSLCEGKLLRQKSTKEGVVL